MAEEAQYSSGTESASLKRKYEDQSSDRPTGFSAGPATGIELAKQRAQEVAARLLSVTPPPPLDAKRPKPDNGAPSSGFDSYDAKPQYSAVPPVSYSHQGTSKKIDIPNGRVGVIIGKGGETIKYLQLQSGAKIQVTRDMDADPNSTTRTVELMGTPEAIASAEKLINEVLAEAESGGSGIVARRLTGQAGSDEFVMRIPNNKVGLIIGKGGETIKNMQASTGARIQVIPLHLPPGDTSTERTLKIDGTPEQIESAKELVNQIISGENRLRNPAMSGGYPQQGYQSRPPSNWAPPAPMQQPGYGYMQPGGYSGPSPQYNMPQPPYAGYPPQQPGGYSTSWDQSSAPPHQQSTHAGGYDYYSQQPQQPQNPGGPAPPGDSSAYSYSQPPSSGYSQPGQGYSQDSYNAYNAQSQSGYGQPQTYDQQQGYGSATTGYGSGNNQAQEGHTASYASQGDSGPAPSTQPTTQQGYPTSQQPSSNTANYPAQGTPQSGYGVPPTSQAAYGSQPQPGYGPGYGAPQSQKPSGNPPVYGQSQSPGAVGGYGQSAYPAQPPPSGYTQPQAETGAQRAPPSGYGAGQPGYGSQTYGAAQGGQPAYGQVPPPYSNSSYGAGYTQAPAYTGDGNGSGNTQPPQTAVAKASPQT
ncbi:far upstream element-binding protein 1-like [Vigna radiata var. radiata]|uniref:Far upstream element-binding protein 1-like n=1 Tax=Vigna radiata var. radiata TaxID=3916 RepID=A0A1S3U4F2_VIGRR|nr:far upstream element-binding protein 1-like [Vigna radiata var. radiata]